MAISPLHLLLAAAAVSAKVLVSYSAADGDDTSVLGKLNLAGWDDAAWPSGQGMNSSVYFTTGTDPDGVAAAHVHKAAHFARSEYHVLDGATAADTTYYIGYHVRWDNVDYQTIVFQWKNYDSSTVDTDDICAGLVFREDTADSQNHTITFGAQPDPTTGHGSTVWTKAIDMKTAYRFGIVVNTSQTDGYVQLYFNGELCTMTDPSTGDHTQKLSGNFYPGSGDANPKFGLYGGKNYLTDDSYIYEIVVGTALSDIKTVAGID